MSAPEAVQSAGQSAEQSAERGGRLGLPYLFSYWQRVNASYGRQGEDTGHWDLDCTLRAGLNLNVLETSRFLNPHDRPSFEAFEDWIVATNGGVMDEAELARLRAALAGDPVGSAVGSLDGVEGLTPQELAFWDEHGYVVVRERGRPGRPRRGRRSHLPVSRSLAGKS